MASWFGVWVCLGVGLASGFNVEVWRQGLASKFGSTSWFVVGVRLGIGVRCLQGRSGFGGDIMLGLSPWGDSGSTT